MNKDLIPGYTELRNKLYQARVDEELAITDQEYNDARKRIVEIKRQLAMLLLEYKRQQNEEKTKGR